MLIPELRTNMLTRDAIIIPISPIAINPPSDVRSRFVVIPYMLHATKVAAQIKNVDVMDDLVYIRNIAERVAPFNAA